MLVKAITKIMTPTIKSIAEERRTTSITKSVNTEKPKRGTFDMRPEEYAHYSYNELRDALEAGDYFGNRNYLANLHHL